MKENIIITLERKAMSLPINDREDVISQKIHIELTKTKSYTKDLCYTNKKLFLLGRKTNCVSLFYFGVKQQKFQSFDVHIFKKIIHVY